MATACLYPKISINHKMTEWDSSDILKIAKLLKPPEDDEPQTGNELYNEYIVQFRFTYYLHQVLVNNHTVK